MRLSNPTYALLTGVLLLVSAHARAEQAIATYVGNEGVVITHGATSIAFDPVFKNGYGLYELVPDELETALFNAEPPFDQLDAIFVSHIHGDHFDAAVMTELLQHRPDLLLFASEQVVRSMITLLPEKTLMERVKSIRLVYGDEPVVLEVNDIKIGASRIPHSGWPDSRTDIENIAFRITIADTTVLHLGDADTKRKHFDPHSEFWAAEEINLALPPYWYFASKNGQEVLTTILKPGLAVGVHVPSSVPDDRTRWDEEYRQYDLFVRPGESREIPHSHAD